MINDELLRKYGRESILELTISGVLCLVFSIVLLSILNYYGYEFRDPFVLYPAIKEIFWKMVMFFMGVSFGVISIMKKIRKSNGSEKQ